MAPSTPAPLLFTMQARQRILAAMNWGEREKKATVIDRIVGTNQQHDLDLSCFVYDVEGNYIDFVGPMAQDSMDQSGAIYHSGDDATGSGSSDDEAISCELACIPEEATQIVFVVEIRSNHTFADIAKPEFRIADGINDKNLISLPLAKSGNKDKSACVLARIFRGESPTGWLYQIIDDYPPIDDVPDWGGYLVRYL